MRLFSMTVPTTALSVVSMVETPVTSTISVTPPTSIRKSTRTTSPTSSSTPFRVATLKPVPCARTL